MASGKIFLEISVVVVLLLVLTDSEATGADQSGLLSLLTNKLHHHEKPVIIILGNDIDLKKNGVHLNKGVSQTSAEDGSLALIHQFRVDFQPQNKENLSHRIEKLKKSTLSPFYNRVDKKRKRFRNQRLWDKKALLKQDKNALRSPIVKKLLRISNSLRCEAQNECQNKCASKFNGKKVITCEIQCKIKYECDEEKGEEGEKEEKDSDPCEDENNSDNDCDSDRNDETMSTKGEKSPINRNVYGVK